MFAAQLPPLSHPARASQFSPRGDAAAGEGSGTVEGGGATVVVVISDVVVAGGAVVVVGAVVVLVVSLLRLKPCGRVALLATTDLSVPSGFVETDDVVIAMTPTQIAITSHLPIPLD